MYTNARSILNKVDLIGELVSQENPDVFAISETWLTPNVLDNEMCLYGYNLLRQDRISTRIGGGVLLYVRHYISAQIVLTEASSNGMFEMFWHHCWGGIQGGNVFQAPVLA